MKAVTMLYDTCFGNVSMKYVNFSIDGEDPEEVVQVTTASGQVIGNIYGVLIKNVTKEHIEKTCNYDYTVR